MHMKNPTVRKRVKRLISKHGSVAAVAVVLDCTSRMVEMMRDGKARPGKLRYKLIVTLTTTQHRDREGL